ncbi:hypothetical protein FOC33_02330 [Plesiomonas shigelloides]|uniref:hypothetical protein n=1 Tax=Plesiomonas shigelloides TaxID=703 RepID=UPI00143E42E0|nr:hypothetical protein [Plesiomonas shigelloides]QIY07873.1 hypothetical protein FOC33_02330 [Plesiomonas shigelloides]
MSNMMERGPIFDSPDLAEVRAKLERAKQEFYARLMGPPVPLYIREIQRARERQEIALRAKINRQKAFEHAMAQIMQLQQKGILQCSMK